MPFSTKQRAALTQLLDEQQAQLVAEVREELAESQDPKFADLVDHLPTDDGDESIGDALADFNLVIIDRHVRALRDIDRARERMVQGTFGTCIDCGDEIAFARLRSYPTAKRCIGCQQKRERIYAHEATPTL